MGVVGFGKDGRPDPVRRVLTFTTPPLERDVEIAGPIELCLHAASSRNDTDFFVKLSEQMPARESDRRPTSSRARASSPRAGCAPRCARSTRSCSRPHAPHYATPSRRMLTPNRVYEFTIAVMPTAYRFKAGQPHPPRARQRRFNRDGRRLRASLYAGQGRARHHPSRCALSLAPAAAGDGPGELAQGRRRPGRDGLGETNRPASMPRLYLIGHQHLSTTMMTPLL